MLRLSEIRKERNMEQKELAVLLSVGKGSISSWETGRTEPNIDMLCKLSDIFECSIDYIVGREDEAGIINIDSTVAPLQSELLSIVVKLPIHLQHQVVGFAKAMYHDTHKQ